MMYKENPEEFGKVVVLMGGQYGEREVSLKSGNNILAALQRSGVDAHGLDVKEDVIEKLIAIKPDRAFIAMHGRGGEDGAMQGLLEYLRIPYTGSGVAASAITMDKTLTKLIWERIGIPTPIFRVVYDIEAAIQVMNDFGLPLCVKPYNDGSSLGVSKVITPEQLPDAFKLASAQTPKVMIEPWIDGEEHTVGILGNRALPVVEIKTPRTFYDFNAKYTQNTTEYLCPCNLPPEKERQLQDLCLRAFFAMGCKDWGRVDLVVDRLENFWFLEINTVPGMTDHSLVPKAAARLGISFDELVLEILSYTLPLELNTQEASA